MSAKYSMCPKCFKMMYLTKHHIYPKQFFKGSPVFWLCRSCHDDLERMIDHKKRFPKEVYVKILRLFLKRRD